MGESKQCKKIKYLSIEDAAIGAIILIRNKKEFNTEMFYYFCKQCRAYHITNSKKAMAFHITEIERAIKNLNQNVFI